MFKFNFGNNSDDNDKQETEVEKPKVVWAKSEEIEISKEQLDNNPVEDDCEVDVIKLNDKIELYHISIDIVIEKLKSENQTICLSETNHSDLLTAVYEGGLKIWECTYDLANYLIYEKIEFRGKNVLDLGCGTGLLGLYCYSQRANVYFQDYNSEVIKNVVIPNILLNTSYDFKEDELVRCKFYSGDWQSFIDTIESIIKDEDHKFDYILTSETIYNTDNYDKILNVFKRSLKKTGIIYLAAKSYYFGVGGSIKEFENKLKNDFESTVCWKCSEGVQRAILKITLKN